MSESTETIFLNLSSGHWPDGTPEPLPTLHAMGSPDAVAAMRSYAAENERLRALCRQLGDALADKMRWSDDYASQEQLAEWDAALAAYREWTDG